MDTTVLLKRRIPLAILAAAALMLVAAQTANAVFAGKPGRIAYSAELPGEDQSGPDPTFPFMLRTDRGFDIFTVNPDGTDTRRLTQNGAEPDDEREPNWSPDGTLLAFAAVHPFTRMSPYPARPDSRLELMAPDGSGRRLVTDDAGAAREPLFFPNGDRLYFRWSVVDLLQSGVNSVALDGSDERTEDRNLYDYYGSHISPDGRRKLETRSDGDVYLSKVNGSDARNLTNTPATFEFGARFAPDMSAIVFQRQPPVVPPAPSRVFVLDLDTRTEQAISPPGIDASGGVDWGAIPVRCGGKRATLVGTPGRDKLVGTKGKDVIAGLGGRDKLSGKGGRDRLCGGSGRDQLSGGKGKKDRCLGGKGRDRSSACERSKSA